MPGREEVGQWGWEGRVALGRGDTVLEDPGVHGLIAPQRTREKSG